RTAEQPPGARTPVRALRLLPREDEPSAPREHAALACPSASADADGACERRRPASAATAGTPRTRCLRPCAPQDERDRSSLGRPARGRLSPGCLRRDALVVWRRLLRGLAALWP